MGQLAFLEADDDSEIPVEGKNDGVKDREKALVREKLIEAGGVPGAITGGLVGRGQAQLLNATVVRRVTFNDTLFLLRVLPDEGVPPFSAGQYLTIGLPGSASRPAEFPEDPEIVNPEKIIKRAYSIASSPADTSGIDFYIAVVREGLLTPRLWLLSEGDRISIGTKVVGKFTLDGIPDMAHLVLLATGTGIAPYISMLRTPNVWTAGRVITVLHGVRFSRDLSYHAELRELEHKHHGRFRYVPVVSREDPPEGGYRGYIQRILLQAGIELLPNREHVFACGNPAMIAEVEESLLDQGFTLQSGKQLGNLHIEKYW